MIWFFAVAAFAIVSVLVFLLVHVIQLRREIRDVVGAERQKVALSVAESDQEDPRPWQPDDLILPGRIRTGGRP